MRWAGEEETREVGADGEGNTEGLEWKVVSVEDTERERGVELE